MPRTALTATKLFNVYSGTPASDALDVQGLLTALDNTNGNSFPCTGEEILLIQNSDVSAHTVTIHSVPDSEGRTGDITAYNLEAGDIAMVEIPRTGFIQSDGTVYIDANSNLVKVAVLRKVQ